MSTQPDPIQPNPWVNPTHGQLWARNSQRENAYTQSDSRGGNTGPGRSLISTIALFQPQSSHQRYWGRLEKTKEEALLPQTDRATSYISQNRVNCRIKKVKVAHTRLPSVGFWSWSRFLAVSLQVTWIINPTEGCHYFPPGLQLPPQPLRELLPVLRLGEQRHSGCEQFA